MAEGVLVVFAKAPLAGEVKTRMCPPFSPEEAADFYAAMLDDVLHATAEFAPALGLEPVLAVHPPAACGALALRAPLPFRVVQQRGVSLAERLEWAAREGFAGGARRVLLRGSDSPALSKPAVEAALRALDEHDLALRPDRDGGYTLVGLRRFVSGLFAHPMSTRRVLQETLENAHRSGFSSAVGEAGFDVDRAGDLRHLSHIRGTPEAALCPRTLAWLDSKDLHEFKDLA